jgi:acetyl esterase
VRVYDPGVDGTPPTVVYLHGGGFVVGGLDTHDDTCRVLCESTDALVVSVDYRLAPEHPFPAAVEDCYAAVEHLASHADDFGGDPDRLALAGDSAGATLSTAVTLLARDRRRRGEETPEVAHQVLAYPATDPGEDYPSMQENAEGYFLTTAEMEYFADHYLAHELHAANRYAFPMAARDCGDLPPTTVLTAGFDPLRDEGAAFAERLAREGTPVTFRHYPAMIHGFLSMLGPFEVAGARDAIVDVASDLADSLAD